MCGSESAASLERLVGSELWVNWDESVLGATGNKYLVHPDANDLRIECMPESDEGTIRAHGRESDRFMILYASPSQLVLRASTHEHRVSRIICRSLKKGWDQIRLDELENTVGDVLELKRFLRDPQDCS